MKFPLRAIMWIALLAISAPLSAQEENAPRDVLTLMDVFELEFASDPQISPDDRRVVYVRNAMDIMKDRKRSGLWSVESNGTDHRKLTDGTADESSPRWSPDGSKLLYVSKEEETTQIFLRWMDTGQTARLTQLTSPPKGLTWSPDGQWIAFSMLVKQKAPELVKLPKKPEGAQWADAPILIERLKYRSDGSGDLPQGFNHLFVLPAEGGTPRQLTSGSFHHRSTPVWTPDGKSLIFASNRNADWEHEYHNYRYPGSPWENPEAYMKFSPISLVGNVTTPTMMLTGTADLRTPLSESEQFYGALKMRNIDTAMVRIPGASHKLTSRPSQLIAKVANVLAWFERYP